MTILHIEDDDNDVCLVAMAARDPGCGARVLAVPTVRDARAYLDGDGKYADRTRHPVPDLILLDLFLPGESGFDFLRWHANTRWADIPVVAVTNSLDPDDLDRATAMGAALSFRKPTSFADLAWLVATACHTSPAPADASRVSTHP